jgi:hypothetical protein
MFLNCHPESRKFLPVVAAFLLTLAAAAPLCAQSSEANFPTPVFAGELSGRIAPRDVGDPRRTRHFYLFRGTEGDLVVNLETAELLGDVDVFLANGLRPLIKFTLFGDAARLSKSFYLRKEETLVLRVEARAVGDVEGTYRLTFGGSFLPAPPELANQTPPEAPTLSSTEPGRDTRRVTSTGARIEEPRVEPTPAEETATAEPTPAPTPTPERATGRRSTANRRGRNTRPAPARSRPTESAAQPKTPEGTEAKPADDATAATPAPAPTPTPRRRNTRPPRRNTTRENAGARTTESPAQPPADAPPAPAPAPTQRLIIVTRDGETLERDMSGVRRVTVENNQVVIVGRDGKVTRRPLANILRMSIEPQ